MQSILDTLENYDKEEILEVLPLKNPTSLQKHKLTCHVRVGNPIKDVNQPGIHALKKEQISRLVSRGLFTQNRIAGIYNPCCVGSTCFQ